LPGTSFCKICIKITQTDYFHKTICENIVYNDNLQKWKKLSETTISKKILGKQHVKFAKKLFGTTSCKILIRNDHLQNLQQILVGKNCPKKVCNQTTTYQKIYQEENANYMVYLV